MLLHTTIASASPTEPLTIRCRDDENGREYDVTLDIVKLTSLARRAAANKSRKSVEAGGALVIKSVS